MIEHLSIRNYLILKECDINFSPGLNILTGETGAGKSILLDALSLILGERADYSIIKKGQDKLVVEGHFNIKKNQRVKNILEEILPEETVSHDIILRRELLSKGISRNFINDNPVSISDMKRLGDMLIDVHSQNEHQSLLDKSTHIEILDNYVSEKEVFIIYQREFKELTDIILKSEDLRLRMEKVTSNTSFLEFELKEINNLSLVQNEDTDIENELNKLENTEDILIALNAVLSSLYEDKLNAQDSVNKSVKELKKIIKYDDTFQKITDDLENASVLLKESTEFLNSYRNNLNFDTQKIDQLRNRLAAINHLKKKYGLSITELIEKADFIQKELSTAENFNYEIEQLSKEIDKKKETVFKKAKQIYELRNARSRDLEKGVNNLFKEVGLETAEFKVDIKNIVGSEADILTVGKEHYKLNNKGFNEIEFFIKTNKGDEFSPLRKSASGGEVSRIMLSIKGALSEKDDIPVLIFDEIDSGISGRIAQKVGKILKTLSQTHQIICITHLPQIAAMSFRHFHVSKSEFNKETTAKINLLTEKEKIIEIAKLISGEKITDAATKSAKELINS